MSVFYNCFRLLFPVLPPEVDPPPDPGGGGCSDCGGCDPNTDPNCGPGCPNCPGTDDCDELITLCSCGECGPLDCCNNIICETRPKSDWINVLGCEFDCNSDVNGCIPCQDGLRHTPGSCTTCCPSKGCNGFACLNPNNCRYPIDNVPPFPGCCEKVTTPYVYIPQEGKCEDYMPPQGQYESTVACNAATQCFVIVPDAGDPGGGGGGGGAPGAPAPVLCPGFACEGGNCVQRFVSVSGVRVADDCPTTLTFSVNGTTYYRDESTCKNQAPECCTKKEYWVCRSEEGPCEQLSLCDYEVFGGTFQGNIVYSSKIGCERNTVCCDSSNPDSNSVSNQQLENHFKGFFNLNVDTYYCPGKDVTIPSNGDVLGSEIGNTGISLGDFNYTLTSPNASVSLSPAGSIVISDYPQETTANISVQFTAESTLDCQTPANYGFVFNVPIVDCTLGTQCFVDCDTCQGQGCYSICTSPPCFDTNPGDFGAAPIPGATVFDGGTNVDLEYCTLEECRFGQCIPITKEVSEWASILGVGATDVDCAYIRNYVNNNPSNYHATTRMCNFACGQGGSQLGLLEECPEVYRCQNGDCVQEPITIRDYNNAYSTNLYSCEQVYNDLQYRSNLYRSKSQCEDECYVPGVDVNVRSLDFDESDEASNYVTLLENANTDGGVADSMSNNRRYRVDSNVVLRVPNSFRRDIFGPKIHYSVAQAIRAIKNEAAAIPDSVFDDLPLNKLEASLSKELRESLNSIKNRSRFSIKEKVLKRLKHMLLNNDLDRFEVGNIERIGVEESMREDIARSIGTEDSLIRYLDSNLKPINPEYYKNRYKDYMKIWKTVASDLNKTVPLVDVSGILRGQKIEDDDSFIVSRDDDTSSIFFMQDGDFIKVLNRDRTFSYIPVTSDRESAFMLDLDDTQEAFAHLNRDYTVTLDVSSDESALIEETYDLSTPRQTTYFMKITPSTIEEIESEDIVVRTTKCEFVRETDQSAINEWIKFKPWPYFNFYVDPDDPFLDHLEESGKITATFNDISFANFATSGNEYPIIPRRIPWYFTLIPTDRTELLVSTGASKVTSYNSRRYVMHVHPIRRETDQRWRNELLSLSIAEEGEAVDPNSDSLTAIFATMSDANLRTSKKILQGPERLPRKKTGFRRLLETMKDIRDAGDSYIDENEKTVSWGTVYKNMSKSDRKRLLYEFPNWDLTERKIARNRLATQETTRDRYVKLVDVPPRKITNIQKYDDPIKPTTVTKIDIDPEDRPDLDIL